MTSDTKTWMNRLLRTERFVTVSVIATSTHRFIAAVDFCDEVGNTLKSFSTAKSESPEAALEALWNVLEGG